MATNDSNVIILDQVVPLRRDERFPKSPNGKLPPQRRPNAEVRPREYLTPDEVTKTPSPTLPAELRADAARLLFRICRSLPLPRGAFVGAVAAAAKAREFEITIRNRRQEHRLTPIVGVRNRAQNGGMKNATVELSDNDLRLLLEACRTLATRYARDADNERNPVIRRVLVDGWGELDALAARLQGASDRIKAVRFEPDPQPPRSNVRAIKRK